MAGIKTNIYDKQQILRKTSLLKQRQEILNKFSSFYQLLGVIGLKLVFALMKQLLPASAALMAMLTLYCAGMRVSAAPASARQMALAQDSPVTSGDWQHVSPLGIIATLHCYYL